MIDVETQVRPEDVDVEMWYYNGAWDRAAGDELRAARIVYDN
jgi:hypothetical protein